MLRTCRATRRAPAACSGANTRPGRGAASRGATRGSASRASSRRRLAADAACPGCGRRACRRSSNGASVPSDASIVIAATTSAARSSRSARASARIPIASMPCVPFTSASPSLAWSSSGASPARASARSAGSAPWLGQDPAAADQRQRETGERREVARRPERALLGHRGDHVAVQHLDHPLDQLDAHARVPEREHVRAQQQHRARLRAATRSGPTAVACDVTMPCCNAEASARVDPRVGERAEAGRDAVHRGAGGDGALDHGARSPDAVARAVAERDRRAERDPLDIAEIDRLSQLDRLAHRGEGYRFAREWGVGAHGRRRTSNGTSATPSAARSTRNARAAGPRGDGLGHRAVHEVQRGEVVAGDDRRARRPSPTRACTAGRRAASPS